MTDSKTAANMTNTSDKTDMTSQDVMDFLVKNPKFLENHPEAIDLLHMPTSKDKSVADFQAYMIDRLKNDKSAIEQSTRQLVENARNNMSNQQRIQAAVLRLLEATTFEEFVHCLTIDLAMMLGVDIAALIIEADGKAIPHIHNSGIRIVPEGTVANWMKGQDALLQNNISGIEPIYGGGATLVQSQILLRIDISLGTPPAILAFGSRDPNMFSPHQAADQVLFLARVIERSFRTWLQLPHI
jgi:uncharacterized protein YigA (DUF484 family)